MTQGKDPELNLQMGLRIRLLRTSLGITQADLAELIDVNTSFIASVELGKKGVSIRTLCHLAKVLYTTTDYLLTGESPFQDPAGMEARLSVLEPPVLQGAEALMKSYLNVITALTGIDPGDSEKEPSTR